MRCRLTVGVGIVISFLAMPGEAAAQTAAAELTACGTSQKQAYTALAQAVDSETRRHALHPLLVARLQGLAGRLPALRAATARAPRNAAECEKNAQALDEARMQLERIAGSPVEQADCLTASRRAYSEVQASLLGLQVGGPAVTPSLEAAAGRLDRLRAVVARDDLALADCRQLGADLADARAEVQRLLPPSAAPAAATAAAPAAPSGPAAAAPTAATCRAAQARTYNELAQAYARLVGGSQALPVEWMSALQALSDRLKRLHAVIADPAAPGWDCEAVARALAREGSELATMTRR